jgi:Xaa-Pro aminopeptidase
MALKQIQQKIKSHEAFFITNPFNISYLSNFTGTNGQLFITSKKAFLLTDFRYLRVAKAVLPRNISVVNLTKSLPQKLQELCKDHKIKNLHFEEMDLSYIKYSYFKKELKEIKFEPVRGFVEHFREIKSSAELRLIIKAQRIAEKVFLEIRQNLKVGKTEQQIAWEIEQLGHIYGADTISFPPIVGFGENSGSPHHQNSNRKLKKGEMVLIDMGMKYKGYCSDMTRMVFTGKPSSLQKKIYNTVLEAQETAIKKLHAGMTGLVADKISRDIIKKAGYGKTFGHSLGHGIGLEVHESPNLSTGFDKAIPENTVVTVEPGIYLENSFGVRIEDMVLVKRKNVLNLTKIPKKIEDAVFLIS